MSQENVEVVRRIYEAVGRRDAVTPFEIYAEDILWEDVRSGVTALGAGGVYQGHEGVRRAWRDNLEAFGEVDFEVEEWVDAGTKVVASVRALGVGRTSGAPVQARHFAVWTLQDAKVTRLQVFDTRRQALEAAGLSG